MDRWAPAPARERPRRRAGQPSFSSSLLDAICDSLDDQPGGASGTPAAAARSAGSGGDKKQQEAAAAAAMHCYYYYKPSLAASYRAAPPPLPPADDCTVRGYFSSSEVEHSLRRLRPIRTSAGGTASVAPAEKQQNYHQPPATGKARKQPSAAAARGGGGCRRPASPGARLASLINAIFSGKRNSARQHPAPVDDEPPACSTARPCLAKTPPPSSARAARPRARRSRSTNTSRTVRFLDIDGEVAVAAAAAGCRRVPVVEVEEDTDGGCGGEESSDASSDLFELENLAAAIAPGSGGARCRRACGDELPGYGTTGAGLRHDIGRRRPFGYGTHGHGRSCSRVV
ncbi:unnamed protein product [Urochloa humidicola]